MEQPRATKLVCTIGPASLERIDDLVAAGMDVARINFSHGTPSTWAESALAVRAAAARHDRPVAILTDLAGPKIRLGELKDGVLALESGQPFVLRVDAGAAPGNETGAWVSDPDLATEVRPGDRILLADGAVELRVTATDADVRTEVVRGGTIRSRAGVAIPAERVASGGLTDQDRATLTDVRAVGADLVGQSFVRGPDDVAELREHLGPGGPAIVAKIETRPAVERFDAILGVADAVMVARGDLGVELPYEDVPLIQKRLVRQALDRGVPSIVATQLLESMTTAPRPTRAEASDAANAIFDGADALMLSGETAIGAYPVLAAEAVVRIASRAESAGRDYLPVGAPPGGGAASGAVAYAAVQLAGADPSVVAIVCYTRTGQTARLLASHRPAVPIVAYAPDEAVARRLALVRGVDPRPCPAQDDRHGQLALLASLVDASTLLADGGAVVLVASTAEPGSGPGLLEVHRAGS